jgi:tetraacyldisaccharide 4'-kinase
MNFLARLLLLPFATLYAIITDVRSWLYRKKALFSAKFDLPIVCVGNLRVGGTGKTPHIELLLRLFSQTYQIAILSRGYGRKTRGFRLANQEDTPQTIGDEPMQFYEKFGEKVSIAVGEERALAIPELLYHRPDTNLILLDDAFQHLAVKPSCSILLTEYAKPFYTDFVLPAGRLRERRKAAQRADIIIVSKCPEKLLQSQKEEIVQKISEYAPNVPVFFTKINYGKPYFLQTKKNAEDVKKVVLLTAIANPDYFLKAMQERYECVLTFTFPDHYFFKEKDLTTIGKHIPDDTYLLCTEKDATKLKNILPKTLLPKTLVMPIEVEFLEETMRTDFMLYLKSFL